MAGIGIVTNPHSRRNRRFPERMRRLGYILGQDDHYQLTNRIEDIHDVAREFKEHEVEILALNGGDGTNHVTLSTFIEVYGDHPLPKIAFLRGGTMNTISDSLGIKGTPQQLLANLVDKYYTGQHYQSTCCNMLKVTDGDHSHYGFIFGNGIVSNFLELYYQTPHPTPTHAASLLTRAIVGLPFGGHLVKEIIRPFRSKITITNNNEVVDYGEDNYTAIIAATVPQIGLGFRPFIRSNDRPDTFHLLALQGSSLRTILQLPRIRTGQYIDESVAKSHISTTTRLEAREPIVYTIDGEMRTATSSIELSTGPRIEVLIK